MQFSDFDIRFTQAFMEATPLADRKIMREHAVARRDGFQQIIDIIDALGAPAEPGYLASLQGREGEKR